MAINKNSILLGTLMIKGPITRPNLWKYVSQFNLYPGITNLKNNMNRMIEDKKINRKCVQIGKEQIFEYSLATENLDFPQETMDKIKQEVDAFDNLVNTMEKK